MNKNVNIFLVIGILFLWVTSCKKKSDSTQVVSGRVIDAVTQQPVSGAEICNPGIGGSSPNGQGIGVSDANGNYTFSHLNKADDDNSTFGVHIRLAGYGGYSGYESISINKGDDLKMDILIHPNTYISFIVYKTNATDTVIRVKYNEPTWIQAYHEVVVTNLTIPDTLTLVGLGGANTDFRFDTEWFHSWPPIPGTGYRRDYLSYNIYNPTTNTLFYPIHL